MLPFPNSLWQDMPPQRLHEVRMTLMAKSVDIFCTHGVHTESADHICVTRSVCGILKKRWLARRSTSPWGCYGYNLIIDYDHNQNIVCVPKGIHTTYARAM